MLVKPNGGLGYDVKQHQPMTKMQAATFASFEQMLESMGLAYQLRCRKCNERNPGHDYCWGNNDTTATQFVVECDCTRRVYHGTEGPGRA